MKKNVVIVGAGPAGSYIGMLLAKSGYKVDIYEEHDTIGEPFQCTGILTESLEKFVDIHPDWHVNQVHKARIACNDKFVDIKLNNHNTIIERTKFDQHLAKLAVQAGAQLHKKHRFLSNDKMNLKIKDIVNDKLIERTADILIGADGPNSTVAKNNGLYGDRKFWVGIQARAEVKNENIVDVLPQVATFGWVVPEDKNIVRIGLVGDTKVKDDFDKLCKDYKVTKVLSHQGGLIPKYERKVKTYKKYEEGEVFLLGDAALQVKATSAGGIIQGITAAIALHEAITENKSYEKLWRKALGKDLYIHAVLRKMMDKFKDKDVEYLIKLFQRKKVKKIVEETDREYPSKFLLKLALTEPRLLYFAKFLF